MAASVLLILLGALVSTLELSQARTALLKRLRTSERTTHLIGHIGQQLTHMRLLLRDAPRPPDIERSVRALDRRIDADVGELGRLVAANEPRFWTELRSDLREHKATLLDTAILVARGRTAQAEALLNEQVSQAAQVIAALGKLHRLNQERIERALAEADGRLRVLRLVNLALSSGVLIGITAVWLLAMKRIRRQTEELDSYVARVEAANEDLNAFAGRVAHDLKNVLSPLTLTVGRLKRLDRRPAQIGAVTASLERTTARALGLLDALLAFSRAGQPNGGSGACSVRTEIDETLEELAPLIERAGASIERNGDQAQDPWIACPPGLFQVLLRNVLGNALKFLDGGLERTVRIGVSVLGGFCEIAIGDTGRGISAEALPRIFDPFYRVPGTDVSGTGIGLATVQRIVQAHGGFISVTSKVGRGTRFAIRLPLAQATLAAQHESRGGRRRVTRR